MRQNGGMGLLEAFAIGGGIAIVLLCIIVFASQYMNPPREQGGIAVSTDTADGERTVKTQFYCAAALGDEALLIQAIVGHDQVGAISLVSRGKAILVEAGTSVQRYMVHEKFARVRILAGRNVGVRCWLPNGLLR